MFFFLQQRFDVKNSEYYCYQPEEGKQQFTGFSAKLPAPCHSFILNEIQSEPGTKYGYLLMVLHIQLNPEFQTLICKNDSQNDEDDRPCLQYVWFWFQR